MTSGLLRAAHAQLLSLREDARSGDWPVLPAAVLAAVGYYAGAKLGLAFTFSPHPISVLWPPNSILLAALLLAPPRVWWTILLAVFPVHLLAEIQGGVPLAMVLCWFVSNASEALIGAIWVRSVAKREARFDTIPDVAIFLLGCVFLAPFLSSFLDAGFVRAIGWGENGYWELWSSRFFSNVLAVLIIVPVIVTCVSSGPASVREVARGRFAEGIFLISGLLAVSVFVFDAPGHGGVLPALLYLPLPFLLWAALRFGPAGSSVAFMVVAFLVIWGASHGRGPFIVGSPYDNAFSVQVFLTFVGVTLLALAAGVQESTAATLRLRSSDQRFETVFRSSPFAMAISRKSDGKVLDANNRCLRLLGWQRDEIIGRTVQELNLYPGAGSRDKLLADAQRGVLRDDELSLRTRAGDVVNARISAEEVEVDGVACFVTIIRDVTALKRTEESLRRNEERYQLVLRATNDVIYDWDIVGDVLWWNENGEGYFGKVSGSGPHNLATWVGLLHPDDRERVVSRLRSLIEDGGQVCDQEYRLRRTDGSYAHVNGRGFIVRDAAGKPLRMIGSLMDITDRKGAEEAHRQLTHVSRLAVVGELTASIAHEINQPLGAILSNADAAEIILSQEPLQLEELRQIIDDIRHDDIRAGEVIRHMRALMRRRELAIEPFDLNRAISDVVHLVSADLSRHRVAVETGFAPLPIVHGDQVHLQQVVLNLILNAVDAMGATPPARRRLRIHTARHDIGGVEVSVLDSGPGIAPEHAERLFHSFFTTKPEGMGLGLSIARSIIEAHGGTIRAETHPEGGASFSFFLPARPGEKRGRGPGGRAS